MMKNKANSWIWILMLIGILVVGFIVAVFLFGGETASDILNSASGGIPEPPALPSS